MEAQESSRDVVLVADDSAANRQVLSLMLEAEGFQVVCAESGSEAINLIKTTRIDVALLDVIMPDLDGFSACQSLKSDPETRLIPVVLVTGLSGFDDRIRGIECGADDFLNKPVSREELLARVRSLIRLKQFTDELENAETVLFTLARGIEAKDPYTGGHCERLAQYSAGLAERIRLPEEQRVALRRASIVHDIGKVSVPEHILLKPGKLTPEERRIVELHPATGESICAPLKSFRSVCPIIRHHHEKIDGSGYPDGLSGKQIPLTARVLTTVDVFDALTTDRPYRQALPIPDAFAIIREEVERGWWDERLVGELEDWISTEHPNIASPVGAGGTISP